MRFVLALTACLLAALVAVQFLPEPPPSRPFERMSVIVVCDSDEWGSYRQTLALAQEAAMNDLGCNVDLVFPKRESDQLSSALAQYASTLPTGICLMGSVSEQFRLSDMEDAREQEIILTSFGSPLPEAESRFSGEGFGYVGIDGFEAGRQLIQAAIRKHHLQPGDTAMLWGNLDHPARTPFRDGCREALHAAGLQVRELTASEAELDSDRDRFIGQFSAMRDSDALPSLLCYSETPIRYASEILRAAEIRPGTPPLVGMGLEPSNDEAMLFNERRNLYVSLLVGRDLALEAYLAILQVCMASNVSTPGLHFNAPFKILGDGRRPDRLLYSDAARFVQIYERN